MAASTALAPSRPFASPRADHTVSIPGPHARRDGGDREPNDLVFQHHGNLRQPPGDRLTGATVQAALRGPAHLGSARDNVAIRIGTGAVPDDLTSEFDVQPRDWRHVDRGCSVPAAPPVDPNEVRLRTTSNYVAASVPITVGAAAASLCLLAPLAINPLTGLLVGQLAGSLCMRIANDTQRSSTERHVAWCGLHAVRGVVLGALGAGMLVLPLSTLWVLSTAVVVATLLYAGGRSHLASPLPVHPPRGFIGRLADRLPFIWGLLGVYTLGNGPAVIALCGFALARQARRLSRHSDATQVAAGQPNFDPLQRSLPYTGALYSSFVVASFAGALIATGALL
jgi:hypothetical protein